MQKIVIKLEFSRAWMAEQKKSGAEPFQKIKEALLVSQPQVQLKMCGNTQCEIVVYDQQKGREVKEFLKEYISREYSLSPEDGDYRLMTNVRFISEEEAGAMRESDTASTAGSAPEGTSAETASKSGQEPAEPGQTRKTDEKPLKEKAGQDQPAEVGKTAASEKAKSTGSGQKKEEADKDEKKSARKMRISEFEEFVEEYRKIISKAKECGNRRLVWTPNLLLSMDDGYGVSSCLEELADLLEEEGIITFKNPKKRFREYTLIYDSKSNESPWEKIVRDVSNIGEMFAEAKDQETSYPCIICFDITEYRSQLEADDFRRALNALGRYKDNMIFVFRIPYVEDLALNMIYEALNDVFFIRKVVVPPVDTDALLQYAQQVMQERGFALADDLSAEMEKLIASEKMDGHFHGFKTIDKLVDEIIYHKLLLQNSLEDTLVTKEDLAVSFAILGDNEDDPSKKLARMCGMEEVKKTLDEIIAQIHMYREMRNNGRKINSPSMHMRFVGNPGTGKTTVARLLAQILKQEGILKKGLFYEIKARDLCGRYVGETAPKTSRYCQDALGSVLFIDEAYTLYRRDNYGGDYGREALDTLITEMENNRDNLIVIMAGYPDEMDEMLEANPGLESRMPYTISFRNYTVEEMIDIFYNLMDNCFEYDDKFDVALRNFFQSISKETLESKDFSNARMVRNLYERIWSKAAYRRRLSGDTEMRLLEEDILQATQDEEFAKLLEKKSSNHVIGF